MLSTVLCWGLMRRIGCTLTAADGRPGVPELPALPDCLRCLSAARPLLVSCVQMQMGGRDQRSTLAAQSRDENQVSLQDRPSQPSKAASRCQLGSVSPWDWRRWHAQHTPGRPQEPGPSQEPGARDRSLTLWGVDWGQMRGRSCWVAHESKQLPCAGTRQRAVPIKGVCGN